MKSLYLAGLICFFLLLTGGCTGNSETATSGGSGNDLASGEKIYTQNCAPCHDRGLTGAPRNGQTADWTAAIARGDKILIEHSINGYRGERGFMPPRGGHSELSDSDIAAAVHYLIDNNR